MMETSVTCAGPATLSDNMRCSTGDTVLTYSDVQTTAGVTLQIVQHDNTTTGGSSDSNDKLHSTNWRNITMRESTTAFL